MNIEIPRGDTYRLHISSASFSLVSYLGTATYDGAATSAQVGIRPRFLIG